MLTGTIPEDRLWLGAKSRIAKDQEKSMKLLADGRAKIMI